MKQQPLLTHDQLVDWLIYHCPLQEHGNNEFPLKVHYHPRYCVVFSSCHYDPLTIYEEIARAIRRDSIIHREITDLYWYWTI